MILGDIKYRNNLGYFAILLLKDLAGSSLKNAVN
jgi:hypothetical protein